MCAYSMLFKVSSMCLAIYLVHTRIDSLPLCLIHLLNMPHAFITNMSKCVYHISYKKYL